ncbi:MULTISPECIES: DUF397 domain-containing protein [unclassified Embleya]|uniref:DUF397 domain-containing protein n=1 Tax=unclassified Embleya TaxID=2699296 RepID=UPI003404CDEC
MAEFEPLGRSWRKSSASAATNCVEARLGDEVQVRDSKAPVLRLAFGDRSWGAFLCATGRLSD